MRVFLTYHVLSEPKPKLNLRLSESYTSHISKHCFALYISAKSKIQFFNSHKAYVCHLLPLFWTTIRISRSYFWILFINGKLKWLSILTIIKFKKKNSTQIIIISSFISIGNYYIVCQFCSTNCCTSFLNRLLWNVKQLRW